MRRLSDRMTGACIALLAGAGLARMWDHRAGVPVAASVPAPPLGPPRFARSFHATHFVRGNLHTHTTRSDGDASPEEVARWYRDHGYGFLALTDHNQLTTSNDLTALVTPEFALVPGEEITMWAVRKPIHVNALCIRSAIAGGAFLTKARALDHAIEEVVAEDGVALINHPNFEWALSKDDILATKGAALLEIASGHPYVHTLGDETRPSHEQLWDDALGAGMDIMGVAVDDVHHLVTDADPEAFPGMAWVQVVADAPRVDLVCDGLRRGALYASTGAELVSFDVDETAYRVTPVDAKASVVFVGGGGRVLSRKATGDDGSARYELAGDEGYVRARVESSAGKAWTPAVRVTRDPE